MPKQILINGTPIKTRQLGLPYNPKLKDCAKELRQAGNLSIKQKDQLIVFGAVKDIDAICDKY